MFVDVPWCATCVLTPCRTPDISPFSHRHYRQRWRPALWYPSPQTGLPPAHSRWGLPLVFLAKSKCVISKIQWHNTCLLYRSTASRVILSYESNFTYPDFHTVQVIRLWCFPSCIFTFHSLLQRHCCFPLCFSRTRPHCYTSIDDTIQLLLIRVFHTCLLCSRTSTLSTDGFGVSTLSLPLPPTTYWLTSIIKSMAY